MPRTRWQSDRLKINAFQTQVEKYASGERVTPPRLRVTLPTWRQVCEQHKVDTRDVFDDFTQQIEANRRAIREGKKPAVVLKEMWHEHCKQVKARNRATSGQGPSFDQNSAKAYAKAREAIDKLKATIERVRSQ